VATTVTRIWLAMSGSITVPTTTVASSEANCLMTLPTSWNSPIDRSMPAVTLTRMPCAPARLMSSSSGLEIAASAASRARSSPAAAARSHHRHAGFRHDGAHVGEIDVDQARPRDQFGDALHGTLQHGVRRLERIEQASWCCRAPTAASGSEW
jgi:hypothetical protein